MNKEQDTICRMLSTALFGCKREFDNDISWEDVYYESVRQTVPALVILGIPENVPLSVRMKWINAAGVHAESNHRVSQGHYELHRLLTENGIRYCILKGLATARYYPDPELRTLGDVDFIVAREDAGRCDELLKREGFLAEKNRLPYEWGFRKNGLEYELHLEVNGVPEGEAGKNTERFLSDLIATAVEAETAGEKMMIPDDFHHGLIILLHTAKHLVSEGVGFRQLCDWAVFADRMGEKLPGLFEGPLKKIGLWEFCRILSAVCVSFIGMPERSWIPEYEPKFLNRVMDDILRAGNLRRDADTGVHTILVEKTDAGGYTDGSISGQLFKNLGQKAKYKWPIMNKAKLLIPFGVIVMCVQYAAGRVTGKYVRISPKELVAEAKSRRALYREYKLFKPGDDY